jgi:hypothetical protein
MTMDIDTLLATAVRDLNDALPKSSTQEFVLVRSADRSPTMTRTLALVGVAAALVAAGIGLATSSRHDANIHASETTVAAATEPSLPATTIATASETDRGADHAFILNDNEIPTGYSVVATSDGFEPGPDANSPPFVGVLATIGQNGELVGPVIRIWVTPATANSADNPTPPGALTSATRPVAESVLVGSVSGHYVPDPTSDNPAAGSGATISWSTKGYDVTVSGPPDRDLLVDIANRSEVQLDGAVVLQPPPAMRWFPGRLDLGLHRSSITYQGPGLATLQISTAPIPADGLLGYSLRAGDDLSPIRTVDGRQTQVIANPGGTRVVRFEQDGNVVTVFQSSPSADSDQRKPLPLDDASMMNISRSLRFVQGDEWSAVRLAAAPRYASGGPGSVLADVTLAGPIPIPTTGGSGIGANITLQRSPANFPPLSTLTQLPCDTGFTGVMNSLEATDGVKVAGTFGTGGEPGGTLTNPMSLVQAGPTVAEIAVVGPDGNSQVVAMAEPFADLLPGQRWGVVQLSGPGYELKITYRDGTSEIRKLY